MAKEFAARTVVAAIVDSFFPMESSFLPSLSGGADIGVDGFRARLCAAYDITESALG